MLTEEYDAFRNMLSLLVHNQLNLDLGSLKKLSLRLLVLLTGLELSWMDLLPYMPLSLTEEVYLILFIIVAVQSAYGL